MNTKHFGNRLKQKSLEFEKYPGEYGWNVSLLFTVRDLAKFAFLIPLFFEHKIRRTKR